jgi:hypothetical protein
MYSDPYNGMLYLNMRCDYRDGSGSAQVFAASRDAGTTWSTQLITGGAWGSPMTSVNQGKLYIMGNSGTTRLWPATVNASTAAVTIHSSVEIDTSPIFDVGSYGLVRVGRSGSNDVLLASVPVIQGGARAARIVRVTVATTATGVTSVTPSVSATISPAGGEDMADLALIQGTPSDTTSLMYWRRILDKANPTTSLVGVSGVLLRDSASAANLQQSRVFTLSGSNWTGYQPTGDYIRGSSFGSATRYLTQWNAQGGAAEHLNIVDISLP